MIDAAELAAEVRASRRYRHVSAELVLRVCRTELATTSDRRAATKAVKRKLHQVVGAFGDPPPYSRLVVALREAYATGDPERIRAACAEALRWHASTRERLPILDELYRQVFSLTGQPRTLLDLGCGLSPLAIPWMRLPEGVAYHAYDVDERAVDFVNGYLALAGLPTLARVRDVIARPPTEPADVAFLLKLLPTLEQQEPGSSLRLLDALTAPFAVVSFPVKSLAGREKGMARNYTRQIETMLSGRRWEVQRLTFESELVFAIRKGPASPPHPLPLPPWGRGPGG